MTQPSSPHPEYLERDAEEAGTTADPAQIREAAAAYREATARMENAGPA